MGDRNNGDNQVSTFVATFPTQIYWTATQFFPHIRVFWSPIEPPQTNCESSNPCLIHEKIKSAFCNLYSSNLNGLIQFWALLKTTQGKWLLSCSDQPFALEHINPCFRKYRLSCMKYSIDLNNKTNSGPPATAFINCFPEVVPDLKASEASSPLVRFALKCDFTSSLYLPVFNKSQTSNSSSCVGVVECCMKHYSSLVIMFSDLKRALESVGLSTFYVQDCHPYKTIPGLKHVTDEIKEALEIVCESYHLTLGQVYITYERENQSHFSSFLQDIQAKQKFGLKLISYCADSDTDDDNLLSSVKEYYDTCDVLPLKIGEGLSGKTLESYEPHFCRDVFELRDNGLLGVFSSNRKCRYSCLSICLRSIHTGVADYAFEFLWPQSRNSLIILESLLLTLKRCLPSFKFAYGNELLQVRRALEFKMTSISVPREDVKQQSGRSTIEDARNPSVSSSTLKSKSNVIGIGIGIGISKGQGPHFFKKKLSDSCMTEEDNTANQEHSVRNKSVTCLGNDNLFIKAEYGDDRTLLYLPISSKFADMKKNIGEKYKLGPGSYELKYFFETYWIIIEDDEDWETCIEIWKTIICQTIRVRVSLKN